MKKPREISDSIKIQKLLSCFKTLVPLCDRHAGGFYSSYTDTRLKAYSK